MDKMFDNVLSVDPSINACGFAVHSTSDKELIEYGLVSPKKAARAKDDMFTYISKARMVFDTLKNIHKQYTENDKTCVIVLEVPSYFGDAGYLARESGSIHKLAFVCGMISSITSSLVVYEPQQWKGQVPKEVMRRRLARYCTHIDVDKIDHNSMDAICIGRKFLGEKI